VTSCELCHHPLGSSESFAVIAVRFIDGELLAEVNYCLEHALDVALGRPFRRLEIPPEHLGTPLDDCYRNLCDCLPSKLEFCSRCCARIADVSLLVDEPDGDWDFDRSVSVCAHCTYEPAEALPAKIRKGLLRAIDRSAAIA